MSFTSALKALLAGSLILGLGAVLAPADEPAGKPCWVFFGTYTGGGSKGIYRGKFIPSSGKLTDVELAARSDNPSYLAVHPTRRFLYAVNEISNFGGKNAGAVSAFALDAQNGTLKGLNQESSVGAGPCHLIVDPTGRNVLVANYGGGSACVLPVAPEGRLLPATSVVQHQGAGTNPERQEGPHAHSINLDPMGHFAAVADLGLDEVLVYRFDPERGTLRAADPPFVKFVPGAGPRHFAFHPKAPFAYVINELNSTVTALAFDRERGTLQPMQSVTTLPGDFKGPNHPADVQVHPSGRFLYGSNRGHDSIAIYEIDSQSGRLTPRGQQTEGIKVPRGFGIDPSGHWLLVANQEGDSVVTFRIDPETGALKPGGEKGRVPKPVCVKFVPTGD
jgi:6-phosphogluconolactonase